jgi:hypothetical protein
MPIGTESFTARSPLVLPIIRSELEASLCSPGNWQYRWERCVAGRGDPVYSSRSDHLSGLAGGVPLALGESSGTRRKLAVYDD